VIYAYNPRNFRERDKKDQPLRPALLKYYGDPFLTNKLSMVSCSVIPAIQEIFSLRMVLQRM
jgi:hypothetical protein